MNTDEYNGSIEYRAHVAKKGWQNWKKDGQIAGTTGEALAMEAVQLKLTGEIAEHYDIIIECIRRHMAGLAGQKNGEIAGTTDYGKRIEAFEIRLVERMEMHRERQKSITFIHREYFISHMYRHMAGRIGKRMEQQAERMERQNV